MCKMKSVYFLEKDYWVVDEVERRAKIKGISITSEIVSLLREHLDVSKKEVTISKRLWDKLQELQAVLGG